MLGRDTSVSVDPRFRTPPRLRPGWRRAALAIVAIVIIGVLALATSSLRHNRETMHPDSVSPFGAGALSAIMADQGISITPMTAVDDALDGQGTILVWDPRLLLNRAEREQLLASSRRIVVVSDDGRDASRWLGTAGVSTVPLSGPIRPSCDVDWLDGIDHPEDRLILRRYCTWELLRSTRTLRSASSPASGFQRQRAALKYCAAFLGEIRAQQETLATFPQRLLDAYLTDSPSQRDALAPFTRWLRKHRLSTLRVEFRAHRLEGRDYASDHRWQMARRFLSDADMDPKTRAAGLLVLLYGIQLTRIVTITRAQVDTSSRPVTVTVGAEPIEVPAILGDAIVELVDATKGHPEGWLFPGRNPGRHLTPGPLSRRLRAEGLLAGSARTTALIELTRQLHPRIVSDLLGITTASAASWSRLAGGEWSDYPALRSTHP